MAACLVWMGPAGSGAQWIEAPACQTANAPSSPSEGRRRQSPPGTPFLLPSGLVPGPVPHRPAARRRVAEHRHMPGRTTPRRRPRRRAVAQHPRHGDQARSPLVPVLAPLRVTPPRRAPHPHATIRTRVRPVELLPSAGLVRIWRSSAGQASSASPRPAGVSADGELLAWHGAQGTLPNSAQCRGSPECGRLWSPR